MLKNLSRMRKFDRAIFSVASALLVMALMSACATQPTHMSKRGLLDYEGGRSASSRRIETTTDEKKVDELYAPREGELIKLSGKWRWPLSRVEVSSSYGDRGHKFHQGVDLRAPTGTPVYAASDGQVTYVGSKIRGYGRMVVLKHSDGVYSVYAHHSKNLVKLGKKVKMGELIAYSGHTGHAHGAHLHFEIRRGTQSFDPEYAINSSLGRAVGRSVASHKTTNSVMTSE